jgi:hypothetical protein
MFDNDIDDNRRVFNLLKKNNNNNLPIRVLRKEITGPDWCRPRTALFWETGPHAKWELSMRTPKHVGTIS